MNRLRSRSGSMARASPAAGLAYAGAHWHPRSTLHEPIRLDASLRSKLSC